MTARMRSAHRSGPKTSPRPCGLSIELEAGYVWVNDHMALASDQPWGGFKQSGIGKENSAMGLEEYTQVKAVSIQL